MITKIVLIISSVTQNSVHLKPFKSSCETLIEEILIFRYLY